MKIDEIEDRAAASPGGTRVVEETPREKPSLYCHDGCHGYSFAIETCGICGKTLCLKCLNSDVHACEWE